MHNSIDVNGWLGTDTMPQRDGTGLSRKDSYMGPRARRFATVREQTEVCRVRGLDLDIQQER